MFNCLKEHIILYRSVCRFSEEKARIHAGSAKGNCVYAGCSTYRGIYTLVSGCLSSVYVFYCDLAPSICSYSILGSEFGYCFCVLGTAIRELFIVNQFCSVERSLIEAKILMIDRCSWIQSENL